MPVHPVGHQTTMRKVSINMKIYEILKWNMLTHLLLSDFKNFENWRFYGIRRTGCHKTFTKNDDITFDVVVGEARWVLGSNFEHEWNVIMSLTSFFPILKILKNEDFTASNAQGAIKPSPRTTTSRSMSSWEKQGEFWVQILNVNKIQYCHSPPFFRFRKYSKMKILRHPTYGMP